MDREQRAGLTVYRFGSLPRERLDCFVSTRTGGCSRPPYASLNVALHVGDEEAAVLANRGALLSACGHDLARSVWCQQVHGDRVAVVSCADAGRGSRAFDDALPATDALVTATADLTLCITTADCVPLVLYDPARHVAGVAHAGWAGAVAQIAARTAEAMGERFGCAPPDLLAAIGPSIACEHYEVGPEVVAAVRGAFGVDAQRVLTPLVGGRAQLDLWESNALALERSGLARAQIEIAGLSTAAAPAELYSHRAHGVTGRFLTAVRLAP